MLKTITVVFLLIFILVSGTFVFLFISFHYDFSILSPVNDSSRWAFRENHFWRTIFRLNERGDARNDYYQAAPYSKLVFEVYSGTSGNLYPGSVDLLKNELGSVIKKPGGIKVTEEDFGTVPTEVTEKYLNNLAKDFPDYTSDTAVIRIYVMSTLKGETDILGQTIGAYSFALFKDSIEENGPSGSVAKDLEKEAILHEIGHLLGAEHIPNQECVMNALVDSNDITTLTFTPTTYCPEDLATIMVANY